LMWNDGILGKWITEGLTPSFNYSIIPKKNVEEFMKAKRMSAMIIVIILFCQIQWAIAGAKIISLSGEVKVRRGMEETWHPAAVGMLLDDIDTILTGSNGSIQIETPDGIRFKLGSNAALDISDLRKISEKELFLYLMSKKLQKIEPPDEKTKLRIGNVSVVHGESKAKSDSSLLNISKQSFWSQEKNGAIALYDQKFYPNSIIKFHRILDKYSAIENCGEAHFYLGKAFEAIDNPGQAIDAYQHFITQHQEKSGNSEITNEQIREAQNAIEKLKSR